MLRYVLNKLGSDLNPTSIDRIECQASREGTGSVPDGKIVCNDFTLFLESQMDYCISPSEPKMMKNLQAGKPHYLLYLTNAENETKEPFATNVMSANWSSIAKWLNEYKTEDAVLRFMISQFQIFISFILQREKPQELRQSIFPNSKNNLYYLSDIDKELFGEECDAEQNFNGKNEHVVWKYMSLEHALDMIEEEQLYLVNPTTWKDPYESFFAKVKYGEKLSYEELFKTPQKLYCTCFTDAFQNDAQWNMYNGDDMAVMIGFDAEKLFEAFSQCPAKLYMGRVNYVRGGWNNVRILADWEKQKIRQHDVKTILSLMLRKRVNFSYEQEIRLMCLKNASAKNQKDYLQVKIPNLRSCITHIRVSHKVGKLTLKMIQNELKDKVPNPNRTRLFSNVSTNDKKQIQL